MVYAPVAEIFTIDEKRMAEKQERQTGRAGLTLVEVMVAVTIFAVLSVSLCFLLRTGIFVRKKVDLEQSVAQNMYLRLEKIARELRNIISFYDADTGFKGGGRGMELYSLLFDYAAQSPEILHITYNFEDTALSRTVEHPLTMKTIRSFDFIEGLESLDFYYFNIDNGQWEDSWDDKESLPRGVKIELTYKNDKGKVSSLDKYVFIHR